MRMLYLFGYRFVAHVAMVALAAWAAMTFPAWLAMAGFAALALLACVAGGVALARQPLGASTRAGRLGWCVTRYGFTLSPRLIGHQQLVAAVAVSTLVWTILGVAAILATLRRQSVTEVLLVASLLVDVYALMFLAKRVIHGASVGQPPRSLYKPTAILVGVIGFSIGWYAWGPAGSAAWTALLIAAAPPVLVGVPYGLFMLFMLIAASRPGTRWN